MNIFHHNIELEHFQSISLKYLHHPKKMPVTGIFSISKELQQDKCLFIEQCFQFLQLSIFF